MRRMWLTALAVTTALSLGGCAKAIIDDTSSIPGAPGPAAGDDAASPATGSDDGGGGSPGTGNPGGDDASPTSSVDSASLPTGDDSSTSAPDSSVGVPDSATPPVPDSGSGGPAGQTLCPNTKKYKNEYANAPATAVLCTNGSECTLQECCFQSSFLGFNTSLCVPL